MTFDSRKELKRYIELKALQQREIFGLEHHTKFELAPRTKIEGKREQSRHLGILLILLTTSSMASTSLRTLSLLLLGNYLVIAIRNI